MHKPAIYTLITFFIINCAVAQQSSIDSLKQVLARSKNDTGKLILSGQISYGYTELNPDSAYVYIITMEDFAKDLKLKLEEVYALIYKGYALINMGNYPRSLQMLLSAVSISEDPAAEKNVLPEKFPTLDEFSNRSLTPQLQRLNLLARAYQFLGILYTNMGNYNKAISYYKKTIEITAKTKNMQILSITYSTLSRDYLMLKNYDSAKVCLLKSHEYAQESGLKIYLGSILLNLGRVYEAIGNIDSAKIYYRKGIVASKDYGYFRGIVASNLYLSAIFKKTGQMDSSLHYLRNGLPVAYYLNAPDLLSRTYRALGDFYKDVGNNDSAFKYQSLFIDINDSLFNAKQARDFQNIDFNELQRQKQIEEANIAYQNKIRIYLLLSGLGIFLLIAVILWRSSYHRRIANEKLSQQKEELETTLKTLKATQDQLIQSEKMASLGELTAGIAHEIQNPLNFVNNFSEVNIELIHELKNELVTGNQPLAMEIADGIKNNEEKINHHGKRADAIVKSMLEHSRTSAGTKEPTDINKLADEYVRLAYHGMRAKEKSFNVDFKTDFDHSIGKVNIVPQDIGRVLLNLFNNAFYAVNEKRKMNHEQFEPTVSVHTKKSGNSVVVTVSDNGSGIPKNIIDKIFHPFFTTKSTGQGTGLGLSLAYDIIKAHGGEIKVVTKESEGSVFTIELPISQK